MKLGKAAARHDPRTLKLAKYLDASLGVPPLSCETFYKLVPSWPMMKNDVLGDCTAASWGHLRQLWTAANGKMVVPTDVEILALYNATKAPEEGAVELDVLNYLRATGKISAYASIAPSNSDHVKWGVQLFGGVYAGIALPESAKDQEVWDADEIPPPASGRWSPGSWGGHAVPVVAYDLDGLWVVTWGALKRATWAFWAAYADEAYAILSPDWDSNGAAPGGVSPDGLDVDTLMADLAGVAG